MSIIDLIKNDGLEIKRVAATNGGEYAGPCPFSGGRDRFRVWPEEGEGGRFWCRRCGWNGDAVQYLMDRHHLSFREACQRQGRYPDQGRTVHANRKEGEVRYRPKPARALPSSRWQDRCKFFIESASQYLWKPTGRPGRELLRAKGVSKRTAQKAMLGWNPRDRWESREEWGLVPQRNGKGKPRIVWLPAGLVIPYLQSGQLVRVRFRRPCPGAEHRYILLPGSDTRPMVLGQGTVWIVVESELDALLIHQEAAQLTGVIALGSVHCRPDQDTVSLLTRATLILVALDSDEAGAKESWHWWAKHFSHSRRWPIPHIFGKDPSEAWANGLNVREWVQTGLEHSGCLPCRMWCPGRVLTLIEPTRGKEGSTKAAKVLLIKNEIQLAEERAAIMEFDGGLPRGEAERLALKIVKGRVDG